MILISAALADGTAALVTNTARPNAAQIDPRMLIVASD
jgi:hypothetical protein